MKFFLPLIFTLITAFPSQSETLESQKCVILLHGLARGAASMDRLARALGAEGYQVVNVSYPSLSQPIEQLAESAIATSLAACDNDERVDFVTHSLGGILVRQYANNFSPQKIGRVVMLGPPNKGSEVVDFYSRWPKIASVGGPAFFQLSAESGKSLLMQLGPVTFECGVIAGDGTINPILSEIILGADDGKVSVESTMVEGMSQHIVMHVNHAFMMKNPKVIAAVKSFLLHGNF